MAKNDKLLGITITALIVIGVIVQFLTFGFNSIVTVVILLVTLALVWRLNEQYKNLIYKFEQLKIDKDKIVENNQVLLKGNKEYDMLIESLEGVIFTLDLKENKISFLKGLDTLLGESNDPLTNNLSNWKQLVHPDDLVTFEQNEKLLRSGQSTRFEYRVYHPQKDDKWVLNISTPVHNENGIVEKINGQIIDITDRKQLENQLKQMAYFDDLTDLPNRKSLDRHIEKALARSKRHSHNFTLMFVDLDDFKVVNDTMGHDAGDILLKEVVDRLNQTIRDEDLVARIGGDEFIVVFEETNKEEVEDIAQRILDNVSRPYLIHEKEANISLSIGISMYPDDGEDKETLIEHADKAMYFAKNNGKNKYTLYTKELEDMEFKKVGLIEKWKNTIQNSKIFKGL